jgi:hypothetical protein
MKTRKLTVAAVFLLIASTTFAQDYAFKVMANKGSNEVKSGDTWQPIKTGSSLKSSDEVKLADNAYLGLISAEGKPLEVRQAGNHKVADLTKKIAAGSSVVNKYTDFILSSNAETKKNRLSATGAVHRGDPSEINVHLPENQTSIMNNTAVVSWTTTVPGPYVVTVLNMADEELARIETAEKTVSIDVKDPKYKFNVPGDPFSKGLVIQVFSKGNAKQDSKRFVVQALDTKNAEKLGAELNAVVTEVTEESAMQQLILAGFYESHHLLIDAIAAYEKAIKLEPEVTSYQESYDEFLIRNNIKK